MATQPIDVVVDNNNILPDASGDVIGQMSNAQVGVIGQMSNAQVGVIGQVSNAAAAILARTILVKEKQYTQGLGNKIEIKDAAMHQQLDTAIDQLCQNSGGALDPNATIKLHPGIVDGNKTIVRITIYTKDSESQNVIVKEMNLEEIQRYASSHAPNMNQHLTRVAELLDRLDSKGRLGRFKVGHFGRIDAPLALSNPPSRIRRLITCCDLFKEKNAKIMKILSKNGKRCKYDSSQKKYRITGGRGNIGRYNTFFDNLDEEAKYLESNPNYNPNTKNPFDKQPGLRELKAELKGLKKLIGKQESIQGEELVKQRISGCQRRINECKQKLQEIEIKRFFGPLLMLELEKPFQLNDNDNDNGFLLYQNQKGNTNPFNTNPFNTNPPRLLSRGRTFYDLLKLTPQEIEDSQLYYDADRTEAHRVTFENLRERLATDFEANFLQLMREENRTMISKKLPSEIRPEEERFAKELGALFFNVFGSDANDQKCCCPAIVYIEFCKNRRIEVNRRDIPSMIHDIDKAYDAERQGGNFQNLNDEEPL